MKGENKLFLNEPTMFELIEKALRADLFKEGDFSVSKIEKAYGVAPYEITLIGGDMPDEIENEEVEE